MSRLPIMKCVPRRGAPGQIRWADGFRGIGRPAIGPPAGMRIFRALADCMDHMEKSSPGTRLDCGRSAVS